MTSGVEKDTAYRQYKKKELDEEYNRIVPGKLTKTRLNLAVNSRLVEQAKEVGINMSHEFELYLIHLLGMMTFSPRSLDSTTGEELPTQKKILEFYDLLLFRIQEKFKEYSIGGRESTTFIEIGKITDQSYKLKTKGETDLYNAKILLVKDSVQYEKDGKHYINVHANTKSRINPYDIGFLEKPDVILRRATHAIAVTARNNKVRYQNLKLSLRIIDALFSENGENSSESGSETPLLRRIREDVEAEERMRFSTNHVPNSREEKKEIIAAV